MYENEKTPEILSDILEAIDIERSEIKKLKELPNDEKGKQNEFKGSFNDDFNDDFNKDIMIMKNKKELKDVFCEINSLYMVKDGIKDLTTIDFTHDMPALVDSISYTEGEPTSTPVEIHGLDTAWCTMYKSGEATFSVNIPTKHPDVLEFFWGKGESQTSTVNGESWTGTKYVRDGKQIKLGFGIKSGDGTKMFIVPEVDAVASNVFESGSSQPHFIKVTGSVSSDEFLFLEKKEGE